MKRACIRVTGGLIALLASSVMAQPAAPSYTAEQLAYCQQQFAKRKPDKVRRAIEANDLAGALAELPKSEKNRSAKQNYLYGKVLYLQALEPIKRHQAEHADPKLLATASRLIETAASQGDAEALYDQAMLLTPQAQTQARINLLKQAADKQFVPAMLQLAEEYFLSAESFERRVEAQALLQQAAELDSSAKLKLAEYYLQLDKRFNNTTGYEFDVEKAISLYFDAAVACDGRGAYQLYELAGTKLKPNSLEPAAAINWLTVAANLGLPRAQGDLAEYFFKEGARPQQAILWGERAAENGDVKGLIILGNSYYAGRGTAADHGKALQYYEQALRVDADNRFVQDQLGAMYYKGEGAAADFARAAELCKLAAHNGQAACQYYLGLMYVNGEGVTQDIDRGINWMRKAAAQDFAVAKNWLRENW